MSNRTGLPSRIWGLLCSLKLAIVLASAATLVTMLGSLRVPEHPEIFGLMDGMTLGRWFASVGRHEPGLTWWVYGTATLMVLLGLNTLCCFLDWLRRLRTRWRKTGEYLIHLGVVMILAAYVWGSTAGFRSEGNRLRVGRTQAIGQLPGHYLRLEDFVPKLGPSGRPMDMISEVAILRGETVVARGTVRTNHPLTYRDLTVLPQSFGRQAQGFLFALPGGRTVELTEGTSLSLAGGGRLQVRSFFPHASSDQGGAAVFRGENLGNPAFELELHRPGEPSWRGWYFPARGLPLPLIEAGLRLKPMEPLYVYVSVLTINRDPGGFLALAGGLLMVLGVFLALFSFYYKRSRGDRPQLD